MVRSGSVILPVAGAECVGAHRSVLGLRPHSDWTQRREERDQVPAIRRIRHGNDHVRSRDHCRRCGQKPIQCGGIPCEMRSLQRLGISEIWERSRRPPDNAREQRPLSGWWPGVLPRGMTKRAALLKQDLSLVRISGGLSLGCHPAHGAEDGKKKEVWAWWAWEGAHGRDGR